jgi:hydroxyacylglutathione hydrolase
MQKIFLESSTMFITKNKQIVTQIVDERSNVYLIQSKNIIILVDTSTSSNRTRLDTKLSELNINRIDYLILTHIHFDHMANAAFIVEKYKAKVIINNNAVPYIKELKNEPIVGTCVLTKLLGIIGTRYYNNIKYDRFTPDILCTDTYDLAEIGLIGTIITTPGHTDSSISIIIDDEIAIVGDALFGIFKHSIISPYMSNKQAMKKTWKKLLNNQVTVFLPGHGKPIIRERLETMVKKIT